LRTLKSFLKVIDHHTLIITVLALSSTYLSQRFGLAADIPGGLIGIAVVFPIVFSINSAYRRREEALRYFASLKAHAVALFYAHRDWTPEGSTHDLNDDIHMIESLFDSIRSYFSAPKKEQEDRFRQVYKIFSRFSLSHELLRKAGVSAGEISRANQYLRSIIIEFERMRNILLYRTPSGLRAYSRVFLNTFPILFGPYFAFLSQKAYPSVGYGVAIIYSLVLVSLDNIQDHLENPYDSIGEDDVNLNVISDIRGIMDLNKSNTH
jgi:hypothetical protein